MKRLFSLILVLVLLGISASAQTTRKFPSTSTTNDFTEVNKFQKGIEAQSVSNTDTLLGADLTCQATDFWIAPVGGALNKWRKCEAGTISDVGAAEFGAVDWANPGIIGASTPNQGSFTLLTFSILNNFLFDVKAFGAVGDGTTDDTAAINAAVTAMGTPPAGILLFPQGSYRTTAGIEISLGTAQFELKMVGALKPDAGVTQALYIHGGKYPKINFRVEGGGQWGDKALALSGISSAQVSVSCKDYAGTAFYAFGTGGATGLKVSTVESILSEGCGQGFHLYNQTGFGHIVDVFETSGTHGSIIDLTYDVTISHMENDHIADATTTFTISDSGSIHLGKIALGGCPDTATLMTVGPNALRVSADTLHMVGETGVTQNGVNVIGNSYLAVSNFVGLNLEGIALDNQGSDVVVSNFQSVVAGNHYKQEAYGGGRTTPSGTLTVSSLSAKGSGYVIDSSATGGFLQLSGQNAGSNTGAAASFDILNNSSGTYLYLSALNNYGAVNPFTASVGVANPDTLFIDNTTYLESLAKKTDGTALTTIGSEQYGTSGRFTQGVRTNTLTSNSITANEAVVNYSVSSGKVIASQCVYPNGESGPAVCTGSTPPTSCADGSMFSRTVSPFGIAQCQSNSWVWATMGATPPAATYNYYVATTGSDSNDGLVTDPGNPADVSAHAWLTINKACTTAAAGKSVFVMAGTYTTASYTWCHTLSGTPTQRIRFVGDYNKATKTWNTKLVSQASKVLVVDSSYVDWEGFDISCSVETCTHGFHNGGSYNRYLNNYVHHIKSDGAGAGIMVGGGGVGGTVDGNWISDIATTFGGSTDVQAIYVQENNWTVTNNIIHTCGKIGIQIWSGVGTGKPQNNVIAGNTVFDCYRGYAIGAANTAFADYNTFVGNIAWGLRGDYGMYTAIGYEGKVGVHNVADHNNINGPTSDYYNLSFTATNHIDGDPGFVNYQADGSGNYHLAAGSQDRNVVPCTYMPTKDYDNVTRPQEPQCAAGAFEYKP